MRIENTILVGCVLGLLVGLLMCSYLGLSRYMALLGLVSLIRISCKTELNTYLYLVYKQSQSIPLQTLTGPEGSSRLRLPDFKTIGTWRWYGCQPYAPAAFTSHDTLLVLISVTGWVDPRIIARRDGLYQWKLSIDAVGNRTRAVPQPTTSPHKQFTYF